MQNAQTKLVSIIIPAYNAQNYIQETIQSVINQTYSNWRLIIVNDGSKDDTEKIIRNKFIDDRITYIYQENGGVSKARNNGIEKADGDYIAFLDADDVWLPENLKEKINALENNPNIDWIYSNMYESDPFLENLKLAPSGKDNDILNNLLLWEGEVIPGPSSNLVLRKKCLNTGIRFDPNISTASDLDFCIQLARKFQSMILPEPLFIYRLLNQSMSRNISVMEHDCIYIYEKALSKGLFKSFIFKQKCFANMYLIIAGNWWVNENKKTKGIYFVIRALHTYPPILIKLIIKLLLSNKAKII